MNGRLRRILIDGPRTTNRNDYESAQASVRAWFKFTRQNSKHDCVVFCGDDVGGISATVRDCCTKYYITCCVVRGPMQDVAKFMDDVIRIGPSSSGLWTRT